MSGNFVSRIAFRGVWHCKLGLTRLCVFRVVDYEFYFLVIANYL